VNGCFIFWALIPELELLKAQAHNSPADSVNTYFAGMVKFKLSFLLGNDDKRHTWMYYLLYENH